MFRDSGDYQYFFMIFIIIKVQVSGQEQLKKINQVMVRDSGDYECQVSGPEHTSISKLVSLTVIGEIFWIAFGTFFGTPLWDAFMERLYRTPLWDAFMGRLFGTLLDNFLCFKGWFCVMKK